jgi:histidine triad (HIT) family protein
MTACPFCARIEAGEYDRIRYGLPGGLRIVSFEPLNPVTPGHLLVVPGVHVEHAGVAPEVTAGTMHFAAELAHLFESANLITSIGTPATQTVRHLHIHVVPRREGDGLALPWTAQKRTVEIAPGLEVEVTA